MSLGDPSSHGQERGQGSGVVDTAALTFVVVVFEAEVQLLRLQARSMATYLAEDAVHEILVVDNTAHGLSRRFLRSLAADLGPLADRLRLLSPAGMGPLQGWTSQQVLKLEAARRVSSPWYVVLDAKNHFVGPTSRDAFVGADGRAHVGWHSFEAHPLRPGVERTMLFVGLVPEDHLSHFPVTRTPFVMSTRLTRELCERIQREQGGSLAEVFARRGLVEFPLYSSSLLAAGEMRAAHDEQSIACPTIWPGLRSPAGVHRVLGDAETSHATVLAVHRTALARMSLGSVRSVATFWHAHGLFDSVAAAQVFVWRFRWSYATSMLLRAARRRLRPTGR